MMIRKKFSLVSLAAIPFLAAWLCFAVPVEAARVAVTVEKLTVDGGFIVEPSLVTITEGQSAADMTVDLLSALFPDVPRPYSYSGSGESFYLKGIYDPARGDLLSEFSEGSGSGWMITVENFFIRTSAGVHKLNDGDVIRWQYTKELGTDLGEDINVLGTNKLADKDALVWKVAEINEAGDKSAYGGAYAEALSVLADIDAPRSAVDSALSALNGSGGGGSQGESGGGGGGCDAGFGTILPLFAAVGLFYWKRRNRL
jgi:hypothetical protein